MTPTIEQIREMVLVARKNDVPPKTDKFGKYYELHYTEDGKEYVNKMYLSRHSLNKARKDREL